MPTGLNTALVQVWCSMVLDRNMASATDHKAFHGRKGLEGWQGRSPMDSLQNTRGIRWEAVHEER